MGIGFIEMFVLCGLTVTVEAAAVVEVDAAGGMLSIGAGGGAFRALRTA